MALEEINNGGFIGDDSAESVFESFNKVKRNFESLEVSNIAGLVGALDTKENKANKQTDLLSTNPEHYPNVNAVNQALQLAETGFQNKNTSIGTVDGNAGAFFFTGTANSGESFIQQYNIVLPASSDAGSNNDLGNYVFVRKSYQDFLPDFKKLDIIKLSEGVYNVAFHFLQLGEVSTAIYRVNNKDNTTNSFSQQLNDEYYIFEAEVIQPNPVYPTFSDDDIQSISTQLISVEKDEDIAILQNDVTALNEELVSKEVKPISVTNRSRWFGDFAPHPTLNLATSRSIAQLSLGSNSNNTAIHFILDNRASSSVSASVILQGFFYGKPANSVISKTSPVLSLNDILPTLIDSSSDTIGQEFSYPNIGDNLGSTGNYKISYYYIGSHPVRGGLLAIKISNTVDANPFFNGFVDVTSFHIGSISPDVLSVVLNNGDAIGINDVVPVGNAQAIIDNGVQDTLILSQI